MSRMDDGFSTTIAFGTTDSTEIYEKEVTPPGLDGGGPIETTTMLNTTWRTFNPKSLISLSEMSFVAAYDPLIYEDLLNMVNVNQQITITFPDGKTLIFWGYLDKFTPNALVEGEQPTANVTIVPTNQNGSGEEVAPSGTAVSP